MNPGQPCIACHTTQGEGEAPIFALAGTVFAGGHVPDNCQPTAAQTADLTQAQVVVTDKNNKTYTMSVSSDGNFSHSGTVAFPITAKVVYMGKERAMVTPQTSGDCNTCHTADGANGAPGRIALPL